MNETKGLPYILNRTQLENDLEDLRNNPVAVVHVTTALHYLDLLDSARECTAKLEERLGLLELLLDKAAIRIQDVPWREYLDHALTDLDTP